MHRPTQANRDAVDLEATADDDARCAELLERDLTATSSPTRIGRSSRVLASTMGSAKVPSLMMRATEKPTSSRTASQASWAMTRDWAKNTTPPASVWESLRR